MLYSVQHFVRREYPFACYVIKVIADADINALHSKLNQYNLLLELFTRPIHLFLISLATFCWQIYNIFQSERAARKATILQMATMYTALGGTLLNVGVTLSSQGNQVIANGSFIGAGKWFDYLIFYVI